MEATKPVAILLDDQFADWEFGVLSGPCVAVYGCRVIWATAGGRAVRSMGGLQVQPDLALDQIYPGDCAGLVLVGGGSWLGEDVPDVTPNVRDFLQAGAVVASICGGTVGLARSGALDEVAHTSNAPDFLTGRAPGYRGQHLYRDQPAALRDGQISSPHLDQPRPASPPRFCLPWVCPRRRRISCAPCWPRNTTEGEAGRA
jgi:putative intracellular protease/amidase